MQQIVIEADKISKHYRLGLTGTGSLAQDLNRSWNKLIGKEDPYLQVEEENDRAIATGNDFVWALRDINFTVERGEVLGIIGKNGAGKSTLLKIMSRTTTPTTGQIRIRGRVASLLEVGTGFHPELTGRDNIFLNGAILGMTAREIKNKFEEIVAFAGVAKYIDTPVKRYSSGMYVRLAFAVAAHLDPEILVVDEVLAVGDAEFQEKAIGKMQEVSRGEGRTVIFVSHNMASVKSLCSRALLMDKGRISQSGSPEEIVEQYLSDPGLHKQRLWVNDSPGNEGEDRLVSIGLDAVDGIIYTTTAINIEMEAALDEKQMPGRQLNFSLFLKTNEGIIAFNTVSPVKSGLIGHIKATCHIPPNFLNDQYYTVQVMLVENTSRALFVVDNALRFKVEEEERPYQWFGKWEGVVRPEGLINWTF